MLILGPHVLYFQICELTDTLHIIAGSTTGLSLDCPIDSIMHVRVNVLLR